jgi:hypothetical protein
VAGPRSDLLQSLLALNAMSALCLMQFTQKKADGEIRWAVLTTCSLLRRHAQLQEKLAGAMASGQPVGCCIRLIEDELADCEDI